MSIAKTSRFFSEKYPAYSSGQVMPEFVVDWGLSRAGAEI
jgi:hypothetical protein